MWKQHRLMLERRFGLNFLFLSLEHLNNTLLLFIALQLVIIFPLFILNDTLKSWTGQICDVAIAPPCPGVAPF